MDADKREKVTKKGKTIFNANINMIRVMDVSQVTMWKKRMIVDTLFWIMERNVTLRENPAGLISSTLLEIEC